MNETEAVNTLALRYNAVVVRLDSLTFEQTFNLFWQMCMRVSRQEECAGGWTFDVVTYEYEKYALHVFREFSHKIMFMVAGDADTFLVVRL